MIAHGYVKNGMVVLEEGIRLPEGQKVTVCATDDISAPGPLKLSSTHSILDIPSVSLGPILQPLRAEDDLLDEMLANRL
jgi:hypothetical protein